MWNGDVIRHNFKWNICDVENTHVLKNKQFSTFPSENLISMKSRSREVLRKNCDLITPIITHSD